MQSTHHKHIMVLHYNSWLTNFPRSETSSVRVRPLRTFWVGLCRSCSHPHYSISRPPSLPSHWTCSLQLCLGSKHTFSSYYNLWQAQKWLLSFFLLSVVAWLEHPLWVWVVGGSNPGRVIRKTFFLFKWCVLLPCRLSAFKMMRARTNDAGKAKANHPVQLLPRNSFGSTDTT